MPTLKSISDLIEEPRDDLESSMLEITNEFIEVKGYTKIKIESSPTKYTYIDLSDTSFIDSLLNNVATFRSTIVRCTFFKSQMTGLQLPEGSFKHVVFTNCRMNLANFRNSTFENCIFEDCDLTEADFSGSLFTNSLFINCNLDNAEFSNCKNKRLEFEDSSLATIKGVSGLKQAAISEKNLIEIAAALARELEITIQ